jgi:hypothetical protein
MSDYLITTSDSKNETVSAFLSRLLVSMKPKDFLNYKKNYNAIIDEYDEYDKLDNKSSMSSKNGDLIIKPLTTLYIPKNLKKYEELGLYSEGQVFYQKDSKLFLGTHGSLLTDSRYVRSNKTIIRDKSIDISILSENCVVWWYCYALDMVLNITPFIQQLNTSKTKSSGNFSISLSPTRYDLTKLTPTHTDTYLNFFKTDSIDIDTDYYGDFFETNFQENDLLFIRFEELEIDKVNKVEIKNGLLIPKSYLSKNPALCWDMIALVDNCNVIYSSSSNDTSVTVSGRDFTKIFEEDGSYFLPYQFVQEKGTESKFVWGGDENSSWFKRTMIDGDIQSFFSYELKSIDSYLKFTVNHLSNLGLVPNDLFSFYGDKIAKVYEIAGTGQEFLGKTEVNGVWQIINLNFDSAVVERMITGENLINPSGNLMAFINTACQEPFVECIMDIYKDEFELTVRQPPFDKKALISVVKEQSYIKINKSDLIDFNIINENEFYSYYEINPVGQIWGNEDSFMSSIIPIINLPFFTEKYGSRGYKVTDSYINRVTIEGDNGKKKGNDLDTLISGLLNDLTYIIESTMYLPFTRKGTITMNGDKRIKVGSFVYNEATNEIFYVIGVSNSISINNSLIERTTSLNVVRGLVIDNIISETRTALTDAGFETQKTTTYFDLIDTDKLKEDIDNQIFEKGKSFDYEVIINEDVFNYFTKKQHLRRKWL